MPNLPQDDWQVWSKYVLEELKELKDIYRDLDSKVNKINQDIIALKIKSGIWGMIAGIIPVSITIILYFILK